MRKYSAGVLVVSDSCANGSASDQSGLNLKRVLDSSGIYESKEYDIVPDDVDKIKSKLIQWSDELKLDLILTTGGSGFSPRDVTPEATKAVIHKEAASISNTILIESLKITKFAMLSRAVSGIRNDRTLIVNLPGSKKGAHEGLEIILPVLKHALDLMSGHNEQVKADHVKIQSGESAAAPNHHNHQQNHHHSHHHHHHHQGFHNQHYPHHLQHYHHHHSHQQNHMQAHMERHQRNLESSNHSTSRITHTDIVNKPRESPFPMISVDEALNAILAHSEPLGVDEMNYLDALGHICAENVYAQEPLPPFPASVKDGFAVKLNNEQKTAVLSGSDQEGVSFEFNVIGASNAGDELLNIDLKEGECVKINTGAPVPLKADLVIQIEDTESLDKDVSGIDKKIRIVGSSGCGGGHKSKIGLKLGQDIRSVGSDIQKGELVVRERMIIKPAQVGICATVGCVKLKCYKKPSVALISTGNELVNPGDECSQGKIRDVNKSLLHAALKSYDISEIFDAGIARDEPTKVLETFRTALSKSDVVISTGGVSMGDKDLVKDVLEKDLGCTIHFARMNMKPGKPTTFASCVYEGRKKLLFCLPGNPVSSIVTFNLVVVPCIKKLMGHSNPFFKEINVKINFGGELDPRPEYHRCYLQSTDDVSLPFVAFSTGNQHSSRLMSMSEANCLVKLPGRTPHKPSVQPGEIYKALLIDSI